MNVFHTTEIDTIALQISNDEEEKQREVLFSLLEHLRACFNVYINTSEYKVGFDTRKEYQIWCNNRTVVSFKTGYSHGSYFISVKFAGLKTYNNLIDEISSNYLYVLVAYLNTRQIDWKLRELDIAIDIPNVPFENLLAICTTKTSGTQYFRIGEQQVYHGQTTYIEKFESIVNRDTARKVAYLYNKRLKEQSKHNNILDFNVQRFEVKLQSSYFNKNGFDLNVIENTLYMYHLMYFNNIQEKNILIDRYNSYSGIRRREIERMELHNNRLYYDMDYIKHFISVLTIIDNKDIGVVN